MYVCGGGVELAAARIKSIAPSRFGRLVASSASSSSATSDDRRRPCRVVSLAAGYQCVAMIVEDLDDDDDDDYGDCGDGDEALAAATQARRRPQPRPQQQQQHESARSTRAVVVRLGASGDIASIDDVLFAVSAAPLATVDVGCLPNDSRRQPQIDAFACGMSSFVIVEQPDNN